jgi:hypothetical protein
MVLGHRQLQFVAVLLCNVNDRSVTTTVGQPDVTIDTTATIGNYETLNLKNLTRRQNVRSGVTEDKGS